MIRILILAFVLSFCCFVNAQTTQPLNLAPNSNLEAINEMKLPDAWRTITTWGPKGKFASDDTEHHSGRRSARISAEQNAQNYIATEMIPVSPGDVFYCSGWVKTKDMNLGENGKVQIQGVLAREDGNDNGVTIANLQLDKAGSSEWTHLEGNFKIPAQTTKAWVRFGMHDATGTIWWDDVEIHPHYLVAARIDVKAQRIERSNGGIPITLINRDGRHGNVRLEAALGKQTGNTTISLDGKPTQTAIVPIEIDRSGTLDCTVTVLSSDQRELFKQKRKVSIPQPVTALPPIPTHWAKEDGPPQISGEVDLSLADAKREGAKLTVQLLDSKAKPHGTWKSDSSLKDGWNHWDMKLPQLPLGEYRIVATLAPKSGEAITDEQTWHVISRADSKVIVNSKGYLEYKGKPIFPLGIFNGGGRMKELADCGMTITHAYNAMGVVLGEPSPDLRPQQVLDETQKAGMMCLFLVPRDFVFHRDWENVRRRIRMFRNHPALLAWDEEEGLARGDMKPDDLKTLVQIIREEDPNHPIMIGDPRDGIRKVTDRSNFFPIDQMDLGMWWWYPLPLGGGKPSALDGEEAAHGKEMVPPSFLTLRNTDKPIWVGVQSYKKPQPWARFPTPVEYRAQAYLSMIHGAKGVMWYGGGVEGGIYGDLQEGHWDDLKKLAKELKEMSPVFMAETIDAPKFSPPDALMSVMLKKLPDRQILLAANRSGSAVDVTFGDLKTGQAKVLYEDRALKLRGGSLGDHFEPYAVHIYELSSR